jgi:hypothetical protein
MTPEVSRVGAALARLDSAAQSEGIEPGSYLGGWAAAQRELVEAMYGLEQKREAQLQDVLTTAKATTVAGAETARLQVEAMQLELRKIDRFIEQARISLGEKESATVQALVDGFTEKAHEVMVIRARAWSQTRYLQTAGALAFAGFLLLGAGYWAGASRPGNGAPHDFIQQCASSLRRDTTTGRTFCAVEVSSR